MTTGTRSPCPMFGSLSRESWAGTSQGFLRRYGSCSRVNDGTGGIVAPHPLKNGLGTPFLADAYYRKKPIMASCI